MFSGEFARASIASFEQDIVSNSRQPMGTSRAPTFEGGINGSRIQGRHVDLSRDGVRADLNEILTFFLQVEVHGTAPLLDKERPEFTCGIYLSPEQGDRARTRDATGNAVAVERGLGTKQNTTCHIS